MGCLETCQNIYVYVCVYDRRCPIEYHVKHMPDGMAATGSDNVAENLPNMNVRKYVYQIEER